MYMLATLNNYWDFNITWSIQRHYLILNLVFINVDVFLFDKILFHNQKLFISLSMVVIVAEVTQKSLGVGYEIGRAVALNKLVICLFRSDSEKSKILKLISAPLKTTCQDTLVFAYLLFLNFLLWFKIYREEFFTTIQKNNIFFRLFCSCWLSSAFVLQGYHRWWQELLEKKSSYTTIKKINCLKFLQSIWNELFTS